MLPVHAASTLKMVIAMAGMLCSVRKTPPDSRLLKDSVPSTCHAQLDPYYDSGITKLLFLTNDKRFNKIRAKITISFASWY